MGVRGSGIPPPLKNYKNIGFPSNIGLDPLKSQSFQSSIQCWAIIGTPAKSHLSPLIVENGFHQYTKPLGALQHLQVIAAEPATSCVY